MTTSRLSEVLAAAPACEALLKAMKNKEIGSLRETSKGIKEGVDLHIQKSPTIKNNQMRAKLMAETNARMVKAKHYLSQAATSASKISEFPLEIESIINDNAIVNINNQPLQNETKETSTSQLIERAEGRLFSHANRFELYLSPNRRNLRYYSCAMFIGLVSFIGLALGLSATGNYPYQDTDPKEGPYVIGGIIALFLSFTCAMIGKLIQYNCLYRQVTSMFDQAQHTLSSPVRNETPSHTQYQSI